MQEIHLFRSAPDATNVAAGERLYVEGEPADEAMFVVIEGTIDLTRDGALLGGIGPGGIVGELALIDTGPRSATAVARTDARVVRVDRERFTFLVQEHPTFALQVMRVMADRLRLAWTDSPG